MSTDVGPLILVVEDDPGNALLQRRRLERSGFAVATAAGLDAALEVLAGGGVALVVLDYRLGETTGLDLHRRMRADGIAVPVILVSGAVGPAVIAEALRSGIRDVVVKTPDYLDRLPGAVRAVLDQAANASLEPLTAAIGYVLLVEDDPGVAMLQRRHLERAGYEVKVAADAAAARQAIRQANIALLVLDLQLPGGESGLELYQRAKADGFTAPAILVTGFPDERVAIDALRAGVRDFVPKSADYLDYLTVAVSRVIAQQRIEQKLAESELRLASIVGTTHDAILMCDASGQVVLFNRAAEEMFDCAADDALQRQASDFIPELPLPQETAEAVGSHRRELSARRRDGSSLPIEVSVSGVVINGHQLFTVIARDVTERRLAEEQLREADRRKDEFLGMLAHELRNPLAAIMNAGEVLHRTLDGERPRRLTAVVRRQTKALSRMVDDLLDVSRVTHGKIQVAREPIYFEEVVVKAADVLRDAAAAVQVTLDVHVATVSLAVQGDATRLEQVVTNLVNNAIKFTPAGGRVDVTVGTEGREAVLRVRDTGVGIPASLLPRVFDVFVQGDTSLDRTNSGLGIGLALVRQIVALHGGSVAAASSGPGAGSEFTVRLPAIGDPALAPPPGEAERVDTRPLRLFVVDDQADVADMIALLLETLGHAARVFYDGRAALTASRAEPPDAMIIDIGMPGMTGYDVADAIRRDAATAGLPLIALTGYGREEDRSRIAAAGFTVHITKPVSEAALQLALREVIARPATR